MPANAEVNYYGFSVGSHSNIAGLKVSMNNIDLGNGTQALEQSLKKRNVSDVVQQSFG